MNKLKRFISTSAIYFVGNILSKLVAFFLLPLYTAYIAPNQYGEYDLVLTFINLVAPIAFFQIWDGMFRFSFDAKEDGEKYATINNAVVIFSFGFLLYLVLFFVIYQFYHFEYSLSAITYGLLFAVQYVVSFAARIFLKNSLFVFSGVANTLITALVNIVLIVKFGWDVKSLYVAASIGCLSQIFIIESNLRITSHFKVSDLNKGICKNMLLFSIPLCIATISYWLLSGFTKISITNNLGVAENGQYAVANRFAAMITVFVNVFQFAWNEIAYMMADDMNRQQKFSESINLLFKTVVIGSSIVCIIIKLIFPYFIDPQYSDSYSVVPIAIIGVSFNAIAGFLGTFFMTEKNTRPILYTTIIVAIINCVLCYSMVSNGLIYAVSILTLSFFILMVLRLVILHKEYNLTYNTGTFLYGLVIAVALLIYYVSSSIIVDITGILVMFFVFLFSVRKYIKMLARKI